MWQASRAGDRIFNHFYELPIHCMPITEAYGMQWLLSINKGL